MNRQPFVCCSCYASWASKPFLMFHVHFAFQRLDFDVTFANCSARTFLMPITEICPRWCPRGRPWPNAWYGHRDGDFQNEALMHALQIHSPEDWSSDKSYRKSPKQQRGKELPSVSSALMLECILTGCLTLEICLYRCSHKCPCGCLHGCWYSCGCQWQKQSSNLGEKGKEREGECINLNKC